MLRAAVAARKPMNTNHTFSQWSRSTAFQIGLNSEAIGEILELWEFDQDALKHNRNPSDYGAQFYGRKGLAGYLSRRGLITQNERGTWCLTKAGSLIAQLLIEAGFQPPMRRGSVFQATN